VLLLLLLQVANRLFDVSIVAADGEVPVWHADVRFFKVMQVGGNITWGLLYTCVLTYSEPCKLGMLGTQACASSRSCRRGTLSHVASVVSARDIEQPWLKPVNPTHCTYPEYMEPCRPLPSPPLHHHTATSCSLALHYLVGVLEPLNCPCFA
jgi:hypothetical protein